MNESQKNCLIAAGINVNEALDRFMNNEALMIKFLIRFLEDENFSQLCEAMAQQDADRAFEAAHALKGVVGNLSMQNLFRHTTTVVEYLRANNFAAAAGAMVPLRAEYAKVTAALAVLK